MRTGYKKQPKNAWKTKGLALPTVFAIDESFRHNEDTKWAVEELERRELAGLFGPFLKVTSTDIQQALDCEDSCPLEDGPYLDLHGELSPEAIKGYWVSMPDLIWAEMDKLHKGLVVTQTQKSESWVLPFPSLITKLLLDQGFPIDMDEIAVNERVGMYGNMSNCVRKFVVYGRTSLLTVLKSQQDFLEFRSQYQQDMLDLRSLLQAILDAQQRPPRVFTQSLVGGDIPLPFSCIFVLAMLERVCGALMIECQLDPTDGFTNIPLTESNFKLQKPYDMSLEQRYSFQNGVHCLWLYADDKPPTQLRTEIRILGLDYSSGVWQFEGYAFVPNGTSGATIAQIHG
ncbi:unnamed protein product [Camellia sinensis]